ncbi:MAG: UbiA family prenyltransferase [Pirellula sp.]
MHTRIRAWAQLVRVPNTLTACADVLAGFSIAVGHWFAIDGIAVSLLLMCLASVCLYWAGMVLNDVHDIEADRIQRRKGPLVDGRIDIQTAAIAGWMLLFTGVLLAGVSSYLLPLLPDLGNTSTRNQSKWLVVGIGSLLAMVIAAYDSRLKATIFGPLLMGMCRGLNLLLGISLGWCLVWPSDSDWIVVAIAVFGHVGFVMGITLAARRESLMDQSSTRLAIAWMISLLGIVAISVCPLWATGPLWARDRPLRLDPRSLYPILIGLLMVPWLRRAIRSVRNPGVGTLVPAIKQAILSIIFLDAAIALQFAGSTPGMIVCGLAIPTLALARVFRMT